LFSLVFLRTILHAEFLQLICAHRKESSKTKIEEREEEEESEDVCNLEL